MPRPIVLPEFASTDTTLSDSTQNKIEIPTQLKEVGYDVNQIPDAQHFNWLFNNIYDWTVWLDSVVEGLGTASTYGVGNSTGQLTAAGVGTGSTQLTTNARVAELINADVDTYEYVLTLEFLPINGYITANAPVGYRFLSQTSDGDNPSQVTGINVAGTSVTIFNPTNPLTGFARVIWVKG